MMTAPVTTIFSDAGLKAVSKLLLNSWSAEYALRLTPIVNDKEYLERSMQWTFPQAYYAPLFGFRAAMMAGGETITNESQIRINVHNAYESGFYKGSDLKPGFFSELSDLRISSTNPPRSIPNPLVEHARLVEIVEMIAIVHERYIVAQVGLPAFQAILDATPIYLRESFLHARLAKILV